MNVSLTPELEKYIQEKVVSGFYTSASEVVRESLRLMHDQEGQQQSRRNELNEAIALGLTQLEAGKKVSASESYQRLKQKINEAGKKAK